MIRYLEYWLVVFRPSPQKNDVRQLGWWNSQLFLESHSKFLGSKAPTSYISRSKSCHKLYPWWARLNQYNLKGHVPSFSHFARNPRPFYSLVMTPWTVRLARSRFRRKSIHMEGERNLRRGRPWNAGERNLTCGTVASKRGLDFQDLYDEAKSKSSMGHLNRAHGHIFLHFLRYIPNVYSCLFITPEFTRPSAEAKLSSLPLFIPLKR